MLQVSDKSIVSVSNKSTPVYHNIPVNVSKPLIFPCFLKKSGKEKMKGALDKTRKQKLFRIILIYTIRIIKKLIPNSTKASHSDSEHDAFVESIYNQSTIGRLSVTKIILYPIIFKRL